MKFVDLAVPDSVRGDLELIADLGLSCAWVALFIGPNAPAKALAAEAIAQAVGRSLLIIPFDQVRSRYLGETEKNLTRLLAEAERSGAVLLFDETDDLFARRDADSSAHDNFADMDLAYVLQRLEAFNGSAILTADSGTAIDQSFLRRCRFVLNFPASGERTPHRP